MCDSIRFPNSPNPPCRLNPPSRIFSHFFPHPSSPSTSNQPFHNPHTSFSAKLQLRALTASTSNVPSLEPDFSAKISPISVALSPICSESEFDQVVSEGPAIIMWTASWCRKCIYLKPKMEKLAAQYLSRKLDLAKHIMEYVSEQARDDNLEVQFYCVDVNKVPHKLVARAAVTKMPTVQLWIDGKKQDEVVGGDKAHLVVNEVRQMIDKDNEI